MFREFEMQRHRGGGITAAAIRDVPLMYVEMLRHHRGGDSRRPFHVCKSSDGDGIGAGTLLTGNSRHVHVLRIRNEMRRRRVGGARHTPDI